MPRPKKEYTQLNIKLDKEVSDILDAYCEETGATKTAAVEIAVKRCFEQYAVTRTPEYDSSQSHNSNC